MFYFICANALNNLLLRKDMCHWMKGMQMRLDVCIVQIFLDNIFCYYLLFRASFFKFSDITTTTSFLASSSFLSYIVDLILLWLTEILVICSKYFVIWNYFALMFLFRDSEAQHSVLLSVIFNMMI